MPRFPGGARFAFSIFDDTDVATVDNVEPVYDLLLTLGMRTTKTVWPFRFAGRSNFSSSETLEDPEYLMFVRRLAEAGVELASHGATMETSDRAVTEAAIARWKELFGTIPRAYANHSWNRENVYWGVDRIDSPILRRLYGAVLGVPEDHFQGHREESPLFWGDICLQHHQYVRNLTFDELNLLAVNPTMPYHDPSRPYVRHWFSATDAENADEFVERLTSPAIKRLEEQGGVCIIATHLGKGFARGGVVDERVEHCLREIANRNGWFAPVSEVLDFLRSTQQSDMLAPREWRRMQWRWALDLIKRRLREKTRV